MAGARSDSSGFPRPIGRSLGQPEVALVAGRKRAFSLPAGAGELALVPVADDDSLKVTITDGREIVSLLAEIRDALKTTNELLAQLR